MGLKRRHALLIALLPAAGVFTSDRIRAGLKRRIEPALDRIAPGWGIPGRLVARDVPYSSYRDTRLDVWRPAGEGKSTPAVLVFHGGGWREGSKEGVARRLCPSFLKRGLAVVNVEYRKAPQYPAPAAVEDAVAAARFVQREAHTYGLDALRVAAFGESAGGLLALMMGFSEQRVVRAIVSMAGVTDLVAALENGGETKSAVEQWIGSQAGMIDVARRLSPAWCARPGLPPVLTVHGDADNVVPLLQAERLTQTLRAAGDRAELMVVRGAGHGLSPAEWSSVEPRIFSFLEELLGPVRRPNDASL